MPQGNGARAKQVRERKMKQQQSKPTAKSQLKINEKAKSVICKVCRQPFMITASMIDLQQHQESKHPKLTFADCFDK